MRIKSTILSGLTLLLLVLNSGAQDTSMVGISDGDAWDFELEDGEWEYTASGDTMTTGDSFELSVTSDISSGIYDYEIDGPDARAAGEGDLGEFGSDIVFTDWTYWRNNAEEEITSEFSEGTVFIHNGDTEFTFK